MLSLVCSVAYFKHIVSDFEVMNTDPFDPVYLLLCDSDTSVYSYVKFDYCDLLYFYDVLDDNDVKSYRNIKISYNPDDFYHYSFEIV